MKYFIRSLTSLAQAAILIHELPIIFEGNFDQCHKFAATKGEFILDREMIYGGYYADEDGNCYYITL